MKIKINSRATRLGSSTPDPPDAVLRVPASTLAKMLYQRIGPSLPCGTVWAWSGRRPCTAAKRKTYFDTA